MGLRAAVCSQHFQMSQVKGCLKLRPLTLNREGSYSFIVIIMLKSHLHAFTKSVTCTLTRRPKCPHLVLHNVKCIKYFTETQLY